MTAENGNGGEKVGAQRRDRTVVVALRRHGGCHGRPVLRRGAALSPVLPGDRLRRHHAARGQALRHRARPHGHHPLRRQRRARPAVELRAACSDGSTSRSARTRSPSTARPTPPTSRSRARPRSTCRPSRRACTSTSCSASASPSSAWSLARRPTCRSSFLRRSADWTDDEDTKDVSELTLSYTFYPVAAKPQEKTGETACERDASRRMTSPAAGIATETSRDKEH